MHLYLRIDMKGTAAMATIKDIARAAGVSQGTVSNVLNGKGNVSSTKIRQVQQAAQQLGYALNQRAQVLRRGSSKTLAVVLPSLYNRCYVDFFTSFRNYAQNCGYQVSLLLTDDQPEKEERAIGEIQSGMMAGTAAFTCLHDDGAAYAAAGVQHICFVERSPGSGAPALSFDYYALGCDMARRAIADGCRNPAALLESHAFSSQSELLRGLRDVLDARGLPLTCRQTESSQCAGDAFDLLGAEVAPDAIFIGNYAFAQTLRSIIRHFHEGSPRLYSVSPLFALPMGDFTEFEMNYRLLGRRAAERLIALIEDEGAPAPLQALPVDGERSWLPPVCGKKKARRLSILTQDSPSINILRNVSRLYTRETGTEISFAAYSYDGLSEVLSSIENTAAFDLARLDSKRWPYYMERVYTPLKEIDPDIESIFDTFVPGLSRKYSHMNGTLYALPNTTSAQLLFYRRDLFESTAFRRRYSEMYNCELLPPTTYQEYNRIARFFTRAFNPDSPVDFGTGLTLGSASEAAKEFLSRYFSHTDTLYDDDGHILLTSPEAVQAMQELIDLHGCIDPTHCATWKDTIDHFASGNAAIAVLYSNFTSNIMSSNSRISDRIGYAMVPGGNPMLGGSTIGICRRSEQKEEALRFLRWLCREETATTMMLMGTTSPCSKAYENLEVIDRCPWLLMARDCFALSRASHIPPMRVSNFDEQRFLNILGMAVNTAYSGVMSMEDTLKFAQTTFEKAFKPED